MSIYKISDFIIVDPFVENKMHLIVVADKNIILYFSNEKLFAFSAQCPHGGTLLTEGYIDAKNSIVCPTHFYKFSLQTGREVLGKDYRLKTYKTFLQNEEWYVEV